MAIATRNDSSLAPTITQANLITALKTAFTNAGYDAPTDDYTSGTDRILVYSFAVDSAKVYGVNYLRVRVTGSLQIYQQLFTAWNTSTKAGINGSTEISYSTLTTSTGINFLSLNGGTEHKFIILTQGLTVVPLGILAPLNRPAWWNLDSWSYGFIFTNSLFNVLRSSSLSPYSNSDYDTFLNSTRLGGANPQTNRRDILTGITLLTQANNGVGCRTSDDIASVCASGSAKFDTLTLPGTSTQYLVINNVAGGLAVRTQ